MINKNSITIHSDLLHAKEHLYDSCNFEWTNLQKDKESAEYGAHSFQVNNQSVLFRSAKITPTKIGQFVTLWKRIDNGPIQPFDVSDGINLFIISTRKDNSLGQFIFPKSVLHDKGIISTNNIGGKRAIRVYPPWDETLNKQAQKTQQWQLDYFLEIPIDKPIDKERAKMLYDL